jgi:hypothetical protein
MARLLVLFSASLRGGPFNFGIAVRAMNIMARVWFRASHRRRSLDLSSVARFVAGEMLLMQSAMRGSFLAEVQKCTRGKAATRDLAKADCSHFQAENGSAMAVEASLPMARSGLPIRDTMISDDAE